jgi:hypothetical protein
VTVWRFGNKIRDLQTFARANVSTLTNSCIVQPQRVKQRNSLRRYRNDIAASALVIKQHRDTRRSAVRIVLFMLAIFVVAGGTGTRAEAQNYPWCADYAGFGSQNCGFTTFQQCQADTQYVPYAGLPAPRAQAVVIVRRIASVRGASIAEVLSALRLDCHFN